MSHLQSLIERLPTSSSATPTDTESSADQSPEKVLAHTSQGEMRTMYQAGLVVKKSLQDSPGMTGPWPPTSDCFTSQSAMSVVPVELYNLLAWSIGASEEPTLEEHVPVPQYVQGKLQSICQDLVYLASMGKKQTPKSLALGLAVRHLTGSSQVLTLLNRLGHCASRVTVTSFETDLAQLQLATAQHVPPGMVKHTPTILVWDNIDFGEETVSGHGTTHHTNS